MRVGIFIGQYDAGGSHTRDFIKCLAERRITVDFFLCNPMVFKKVNTLSYSNDLIRVYYFQRDFNYFNKSNNLIIKNLRRINALLIFLYQLLS